MECFAHKLGSNPKQGRYVSGPHSCRGCMTKRSKACPCLELKNSCPTTKPARCGAATKAESFCDATSLPATGSGATACVLKGTFKQNCEIGGQKLLILYRSAAAPAGTPATLPTSDLSSYIKLKGWPKSHATTLGPPVHPCNLNEWIVTHLDPGMGYYYDPLPSGAGYCKLISSGNVKGVRAEYNTAWTKHHRGAVYLPPAPALTRRRRAGTRRRRWGTRRRRSFRRRRRL